MLPVLEILRFIRDCAASAAVPELRSTSQACTPAKRGEQHFTHGFTQMLLQRLIPSCIFCLGTLVVARRVQENNHSGSISAPTCAPPSLQRWCVLLDTLIVFLASSRHLLSSQHGSSTIRHQPGAAEPDFGHHPRHRQRCQKTGGSATARGEQPPLSTMLDARCHSLPNPCRHALSLGTFPP